MKFYAVSTGNFKGVVESWDEALLYLVGKMGFKNQTKKFSSRSDAEEWLNFVDPRPMTQIMRGVKRDNDDDVVVLKLASAGDEDVSITPISGVAVKRVVEPEEDDSYERRRDMLLNEKKQRKSKNLAHMGSGAYFVDKVRWSTSLENTTDAPLCEEQQNVVDIATKVI
jgi:hypothetical protein